MWDQFKQPNVCITRQSESSLVNYNLVPKCAKNTIKVHACVVNVYLAGMHGLACRRTNVSTSRCQRPRLQSDAPIASIPATKEPAGTCCVPMGNVPMDSRWSRGKWDAVPHGIWRTLCHRHSYLSTTSARAGWEAQAALDMQKGAKISVNDEHTPLNSTCSIDILGPINSKGLYFLSDLGRRLTEITGNPRETSFLFQHLSATATAQLRLNAIGFQIVCSIAIPHYFCFS